MSYAQFVTQWRLRRISASSEPILTENFEFLMTEDGTTLMTE